MLQLTIAGRIKGNIRRAQTGAKVPYCSFTITATVQRKGKSINKDCDVVVFKSALIDQLEAIPPGQSVCVMVTGELDVEVSSKGDNPGGIKMSVLANTLYVANTLGSQETDTESPIPF
jgi:hypothetical protein